MPLLPTLKQHSYRLGLSQMGQALNLQRKKGELYLEKAACLDFHCQRPVGQLFSFRFICVYQFLFSNLRTLLVTFVVLPCNNEHLTYSPQSVFLSPVSILYSVVCILFSVQSVVCRLHLTWPSIPSCTKGAHDLLLSCKLPSFCFFFQTSKLISTKLTRQHFNFYLNTEIVCNFTFFSLCFLR